MPGQSIAVDAVIHWKHFLRYFADAAFFSHDALVMEIKDGKAQQRQKMYTRSAIVFCALALESAANCCLDVLSLQKGAFEDFEKLQSLAKFDLYLRHIAKQATLDREHKLVRPIRNLLSCRNTFVHSKVQTERVEKGLIEPKIWEPLGLPQNPAYWQPLHAVKCFTVTCDFLNFFFFELCGFPLEGNHGRRAVSQLLRSIIAKKGDRSLPGDVEIAAIQDSEWAYCMDAATAWDLDFAFLGLYTSGANNEQTFPKRTWGDYSHCRVEELSIPWQPIIYSVPKGLGMILVGKPGKQSVKKKGD